MITKEPTNNSTEILNRVDRFTSDSDWSAEELRHSLKADGIDPNEALKNIKARLAPVIKLKDSPQVETNQVLAELLATKVFPGILAAAMKLNLAKERLAEMTGLSEILLLKLDRRLISLAGFSKIAALVADALQTTKEIVQNYVDGHPLYPAEVNFKADSLPELPQKQSFADAVENDRLLSPEAKQRLLALRDDQ